ncbi:MAG: zinc-dependent metalloprotease [Nostocoides sp.]
MSTDHEHVDWGTARAAGRRLAASGPKVPIEEARAEVAALRVAAERAREPVAATSLMATPPDAPTALVVDRGAWIDANAESMAALLDPVVDKVFSGRRGQPSEGSIGAKLTGAEAGAMLAFMASKVLGQYDLAPQGTPRLLLVAPNILAVGRELEVDPADFRQWVCLHEETHRVQFTAVPWLREHLLESSRRLTADLAPDPEAMSRKIREIASRLPQALSEGGLGLVDLVTTEEQRDQIAKVTAIMSLLEGHADVVMDEVGPEVIPTVAQIREKFTQRRTGVGAFDRLLRRLLGLEAKMRQYRDGAVFVRAVVDQVGWDGFNAVWTSPATLPEPIEIESPAAWIRRVHG